MNKKTTHEKLRRLPRPRVFPTFPKSLRKNLPPPRRTLKISDNPMTRYLYDLTRNRTSSRNTSLMPVVLVDRLKIVQGAHMELFTIQSFCVN